MKCSPLLILLTLVAFAGLQSRVCCAQNEPNASVRKVVSKVAPVYPHMARTLNLIGTVKLEVLVQANGSVKSAQVKGGNPLLAQSAQNAVLVWKWEKADHETTEQVEIHFSPAN